MSSSEIFISVVVPVYNEAAMVAETIRRVEAYFHFKQESWELILVSDGSTDQTVSRIQEQLNLRNNPAIRLIAYDQNRGKGYASRQGVLAARGRLVLLTDADLSSPIKECQRLIQALEQGCDIAIGSRSNPRAGCQVQQTLKRRIAGRIFNGLVQALVLRGIRDTQCGFKCFKAEAAKILFSEQKLDGFCFDVEVLYLAQRRRMKIAEVPVMWRQGPNSKVRLFRDSIRMTGDLLKIRRQAR